MIGKFVRETWYNQMKLIEPIMNWVEGRIQSGMEVSLKKKEMKYSFIVPMKRINDKMIWPQEYTPLLQQHDYVLIRLDRSSLHTAVDNSNNEQYNHHLFQSYIRKRRVDLV